MLIRVADPYATLAQLLRMVEGMKPQPEGVEQPSYVSEGVGSSGACIYRSVCIYRERREIRKECQDLSSGICGRRL